MTPSICMATASGIRTLTLATLSNGNFDWVARGLDDLAEQLGY
ncbi:MAG: hypothetical protein QF614_02375 [SAR324 cluster bacterium]|nr:hypothetical protein [SAR324 cluster bacterium]MDP7317952.1 hypothetical protein [SAR324 cluster bacterium]MDP7463314.1 hypothetical protein [SAR324 cluster bacterium]MDP7629153.1 hypothetical protein [SAR324 cluster bacterium]|tara:strand:+ start:376 stop:504 length:129 start_codon:yes stop_codon:yes gene_type:complete